MQNFSLNRMQAGMLMLGFLLTLSMHLLLFSFSPLLRSIAVDLALNDTEAGFLFSVSVLTLMLFRVPWGILFDRKGSKATMRLLLASLCIFGLLRGFAVDYFTLLTAQFLLGVALSGVIPAIPKLVSNWFPREKAGVATGICLAGFPVGDMIAVGVTPHLIEVGNSWWQIFRIYGLFTLVLLPLWWKCLGKQPRNLSGSSPAAVEIKRDFAKLLRMKEIWLLTGLYFCAGGCYDTMLVWIPDMLHAQGLNWLAVSTIAIMLPIGFLAAALTVGALSDKLGLRKPFMIVMGIVSGPFVYLAGVAVGLWSYAAAFVVGFCTVGVLTLVLVVPVEMPRPSSLLSSSLGIVTSIGNAGSFLLPTVVGQLRDLSGTFLLSLIVLAVVSECMLLLALMLPETGKKGKINVG